MIVRQVRITQKSNILLDAVALVIADILGLLIRFELRVPEGTLRNTLVATAFTMPIRLAVLSVFGIPATVEAGNGEGSSGTHCWRQRGTSIYDPRGCYYAQRITGCSVGVSYLPWLR